MTTVPFRSKQSAIGILRKLLPAAGDRAPLSAMLEIADRCNEVCVHCYQVQGQKGELPTEDWRRILDELADMGVLFLTLSGGEATLRKDFIELVAHARRRGFAVKIFTNGLSMTDELAQALADLAVQEVQITLYSPRAEVHDWVTRVPGSFEKVLAGARALRTRDVAVVLKTPLMSFNVEDRHAYVALARELDTDFMLDPGLDAREDGDRNPQQFSISHDQWKAVQVDEKLGRKSQRGGPLEPALEVCGGQRIRTGDDLVILAQRVGSDAQIPLHPFARARGRRHAVAELISEPGVVTSRTVRPERVSGFSARAGVAAMAVRLEVAVAATVKVAPL